MGQNTRYDPVHRHREAERETRERASQLRAELTDTLLTVLSRGADAAYLVQRMAGHDLARLGVLHPAVRFISSAGQPADRTVEVSVEVASTEAFDPYELESAELLRIVRTRLWEETRIEQAERVELLALCAEIQRRLGTVASR